jgi:hypothetical protein
MYKSPTKKGREPTEKISRAQIFNQSEDECRWPFNVFGQVADCEFNYQVLEQNKDFAIVKFSKDNVLYHSTQVLGKPTTFWWENSYPASSADGGAWFTSTPRHAMNFTSKTHTLVYVLKRDAILIFVRNLEIFGEGVRGFEFVSRYYTQLKNKGEDTGHQIDGYLSCNECEVFLENDKIPEVLEKNPAILMERSSAFID